MHPVARSHHTLGVPRRYACGPQPFWRKLQAALTAAGWPAGQQQADGGMATPLEARQGSSGGMESDAAGPAIVTVVRAQGDSGEAEDPLPPVEEAYFICVTLARSGKQFLWDSTQRGNLLSAAEWAGISLPFRCRAGQCGSCTARLLSGRAGYDAGSSGGDAEVRAAAAAKGDVMMCCAVPLAGARLEEAEEGGGPAVYQGPTFDR